MPDQSRVQLEEYKALLEEHRRNRSYVFERTVVILAIVAASAKVFDQGNFLSTSILVAVLIFLFSYNLKFTVHRLESDARIIAYLQIFHEGSYKDKWIGWENALREYRIWEQHEGEEAASRINNGNDPMAIPNSHINKGSYPALWSLHICLVVMAWAFLVGLNLKKIGDRLTLVTHDVFRFFGLLDTPNLLGAAVLAASTCYFLYTALRSAHYSHIDPFIESERTKWVLVVDDDIKKMFAKKTISIRKGGK